MSILNPWVLLGITLFYVSSLAGSYTYGHSNGVNGERVVWQQKQTSDLAAYNAKYNELEGKARASEQKRVLDAQALSVKHLNEEKELTNVYQANLNALRTKSVRLRDPDGAKQTCGSTASETSTSAIGTDSGTGSELSDRASAFLYEQSHRADQVVVLFNQCVRQLKADRE